MPARRPCGRGANHPAIVTIYSVEEADGHHFLTMELVAGRSLDHRIPASGLDAERIFAIADALAGTLAAAHNKGPSTATSSAPT